MAYDSTSKKLHATESKGISTSEVAVCLKDYRVTSKGRDIGLLCTSPKINKWARRKPIEYPSVKRLTDAQRKGSEAEQAKGIFYGIEIAGANNIALKDLAEIHDVEFVYHRPTSRFRLLDFDGYVHTAQPQPYANMPGDGFYNDDNNDLNGQGVDGINVNYNIADTTGVDLLDRLVGTDLDYVLRRAFPCIVITKNDGSTYFTALDYEGGSPRPMYNGVNYAGSNWTCRMSKRLYAPEITDGNGRVSPFSESEVVTASICFVTSASNLSPLLSAGGINYGEWWVQVTSATTGVGRPFVIPGANGISLNLKRYFDGIIFRPKTPSVLAISGSNPSFTIPFEEITGLTSTNSITARATVRLSDGRSAYSERVFDGWTGSTALSSFTVRLDSVLHVSGTKYSGTVSIRTQDGTADHTETIEFNDIG